MSNATELATGLRTLVDANNDGDNDAAIEAVCKAIRESGCEVDIEIDDDEPDALDGGDYPLWVISGRTLTVDGEMVAEWTRCAVGGYGLGSTERNHAATWSVEEDTDGGDVLPDEVRVALNALGIEDDIPCVDEPAPPTVSDDGGYAVLFRNPYGNVEDWEVVSRHGTKDDAIMACASKERGFRAATTAGSYGPEWCVGCLTSDGEWHPIDDDCDE